MQKDICYNYILDVSPCSKKRTRDATLAILTMIYMERKTEGSPLPTWIAHQAPQTKLDEHELQILCPAFYRNQGQAYLKAQIFRDINR